MKTMKGCVPAALLVLFLGFGCLAGTRDQARRIMIPEFNVEDASPNSVFKRIRVLSKTYSPDHKALNFVYRCTPAGKKVLVQPSVSMQLSNISAEKLIEYVCMATGLKCRFDEKAVIVGDQALPKAPMETRVFQVAPGVVDPPRTRPRAKRIDGDHF
jgi:hypothetical protein